MTVNIGVVGVGAIGTVHAHNLATQIAGSRVSVVTDVDADRADRIAGLLGAVAVSGFEELVRSADVDAVVIGTPGFTHADIVLDALSVGKAILCEKPLSLSSRDALRIVEAEVSLNRQLVQVGFMRRFDLSYLELKRTIDTGAVGEVLISYMCHRNGEIADHFGGDHLAIYDSLIHEFDVARWLFGEEVVAVTAIHGKPTPQAHPGSHDPLILLLETSSAALVVVELYIANGFGYQVGCDVVGSSGAAELITNGLARVTTGGLVSEPVHRSWRERFADAYRLEVQAWIRSIASGSPVGANAWDGYAAVVIADGSASALADSRRRVPVSLPDRPDLYGGARTASCT